MSVVDGRGTRRNPENRYELMHVEPEPGEEAGAIPTICYRDASRSVLAENQSPDLGFRWSLNPYRGCEHGCIYCYARPSHEYLGFSAGLDFEHRLMVKTEVAALLRRTFASRRWQGEVVALSGNTDCYQPVERRLALTRACLEVFRDFRNPVAVITKNALVARDADLLADLALHGAARAMVSVTTLDPQLARRMEPRASTPEKRLEAIRTLSAAGIPTGVMVAPIVPGLNDSEIPAILERAAAAGAITASRVLLRLPQPVDELFRDWLQRHYPERRKRVVARIRDCRDGRMNDPRFGHRMRGTGIYAEQIDSLFRTAARRTGLDGPIPALRSDAFRRPGQTTQLALFDHS